MSNKLENAVLELARAAKEAEEAMSEAYKVKKENLRGFSYSPSITAQHALHEEIAQIIRLYHFDECQLRAIHSVNGAWKPSNSKPQLTKFCLAQQ